jgi:hypothetical protein
VSDAGSVRPQLKPTRDFLVTPASALVRQMQVDFRIGLRYSSEVLMYQRFVR